MALPLPDRMEAGAMLAERLQAYRDRADVIVLALPRGGVPVGAAIADELNVRLDVVVVRKLGVPGHAELAMGAVASGGLRIVNDDVVVLAHIDEAMIDRAVEKELAEIARREQLYRRGRRAQPLASQTVIVVDDGLATGSTMAVAVQAIRREKPARVVVAVPVAARDSCVDLAKHVDEMVCLYTPEPFRAVSIWYDEFEQTSDDEVIELLRRASERGAALLRQ